MAKETQCDGEFTPMRNICHGVFLEPCGAQPKECVFSVHRWATKLETAIHRNCVKHTVVAKLWHFKWTVIRTHPCGARQFVQYSPPPVWIGTCYDDSNRDWRSPIGEQLGLPMYGNSLSMNAETQHKRMSMTMNEKRENAVVLTSVTGTNISVRAHTSEVIRNVRQTTRAARVYGLMHSCAYKKGTH
jgi:hypothetical protein